MNIRYTLWQAFNGQWLFVGEVPDELRGRKWQSPAAALQDAHAYGCLPKLHGFTHDCRPVYASSAKLPADAIGWTLCHTLEKGAYSSSIADVDRERSKADSAAGEREAKALRTHVAADAALAAFGLQPNREPLASRRVSYQNLRNAQRWPLRYVGDVMTCADCGVECMKNATGCCDRCIVRVRQQQTDSGWGDAPAYVDGPE